MADRKRERSISESEYEYNDQTACETSTNKRSLYKSNALCKRTSEQSLSDVIQKLTQQIEHIEKNFAKCQNVTKNTKVNDISCDDELIYQPPNKIIKYDNDIISANFCNSDENSIGSTNKIDPTNHVNKKIKLDKNIIFQKDVDDLERDSKSLTNEEVETLLELSHKIDDKIIYEDNTCIKTHNVQTIENSDSVQFLDQADNFNTTMEHVFNESMLNNNNISFSTEDQSIAQSNDFFENSINKSAEFMNIGDIILMSETCENNNESIDQDGLLDLTKCENDENILDLDKCRNVTNESINSTTSLKILTIEDEEMLTKLVNNEDEELGIGTDCTDKTTGSQTCEDYINENISKKRKNQDDLLVVTTHVSDENVSMVNEEKSTSQSNESSEISKERSAEFVNVGDIILMPETCENNNESIDQDDLLDLTKCENDENILDHDKCRNVTNESINCTRSFENVNSEIQTDSDQKTQYSGDSIHETDIGRMIVQERKSCQSTMHEDDQETVCETLNNQEENIFEPSNAEDDSYDVNILEAVHPKIIDCENNFNQKDLLDINEYVNEEIMSENENVTCKSKLEQNNKGSLKILTIEDEEMLTKLVNNEDEELGIGTDCTDKTTGSQTCEDYINENISKKRKNQDDLLVVTTHVSDENVSMVNEEKSTSQSNESSEISKERSAEFVNVGDIILMPETCENNNESIDQDDLLDLTKCENDENILDHDKCRNVTNESINCTRSFENVNSEIQTDSDQKTQYSGDSIHETDIGRMIVQERKSCQSTMHEDDQETVCETLNNQEENIFEPSNAEDDSYDVNILEAVHPKIIDCENNFNQKDLLDINEYVNEEIMSENENVTCKSKLEQNNKGSLKILTIEDEEMLTKLVNNEDEELGIGTDCTDKTTGSQTCEDYINENIPKKRKNQDDLLVVTTQVSHENVGMVNEEKRLDQTDKPTKSMNHGVDLTIFNNKEIDNLTERHFTNDEVFVMPVEVIDGVNYNSLSPNYCCSMDDTAVNNFEFLINERNSQSSVNGDQFISNTFYFGTENCRDVSVHTIHSLDAYEMNNSVRNNTTVHSIENNDSLVSLNNEIENSIVELYCNSDDKTLSGIKNKGYSNEEEYAGGIMKHTIEDILVSLESSNSYRHGLINFSKSVNDFENILEPVDESCMNPESITNISNTIPLYELQKTVSEINEYNNNTIDKSIFDDKLIESKRDYEKISSAVDKITMSQIVTENNAHKITSQSNESFEISKERSAEFVNVGDIILMPETCENNNESIDQDDLLDLTKCENDENILDHDKCRNVTNESINCTRSFENVNSEIQTDSDQKTQYSGDSIHETDIGRMIVQERKSCQSTMHEDDQETVCETLNNQEENIFEPSNAEDDSYDVNILEAVHPKIIDCENNFNQKDLLDINEYVNEEIMSENENVTCKSKLEQNNKGSLKILTIEDEEMLTKLVNNEDEELGIGTDCTDKTTGSQTCEDYINENISKKRKNQDDLLVVTTHVSDENVSMVNEEKSTSQSNESSEISKERSAEFVNVGDIILMPETCENNNESIDQDDLLDLTKCENDENILDHDKCRNVTNESINCTRSFENVNSEIQTDSDQKTQYSGDSIHETDIGRMIVQERKSCQSTMHEDDQETVCETLNNQEENIFEPSNAEDDSYDVNILEAVHPKIIDCENNFNQKDLLDINEYVNEEIMSENENVTCKSKLEQNNKGSLKILTIEDEEMLTKLVNNEDEELGIGTDCTDKTTGSQTCEDYINENIPKNQDDLLVVTTHLSDENVSMVNEGKSRLDQTDKPTKSMNHGVDLTIFNNKEIDKNLTERSVSFNSSDARQILDSSNDDSEHFDDSLLFKPSDRDLVRYGIECEAYEKSISQSLNNLENYVSNKEVIPQCNTPTSLNNLVSSSYVKDYEDNVVDFYDCELSSIENSDVEDNLLLSFVKDTSMDDCILEKNQNKLKNATNSTSNELTCDTNFKIPNLGSPSESCNNLTNVVSLVHSPSHDHQNNEIISTSISKTEMQMNPDADDKLESVNSITSCNVISSLNDSDNINNIQSNNLCIDQGNFNENQNLEDTIKSQSQNNKNESISGSNTHQNIKKSQKSYEDNESETESSMKITGNCTIPKSNIEEIHKTNIVQSSSSVIDQSEIDKKKYLDEIIKNEQLFNKFDEKLDVNESAISPFISQSLAKPSILKGALAKKAAAHININDMGDKALSTYLTQQAMTLDVLEVLHKSLDTCPSSDILMEDPKGLVVPLMPHQKHAIAWLIWRECQEPHGGILADDMGLGKTLSMISLILKSKEKKQDSLLPVVSIDNGRNDVINGGTLVVCPASLINQWETEVKTKLEPGLLKVVQYYGMNRDFSALELAKNDLVITSYNIVMWDQKKKQNTSPLYRIKWDRIILDEGHNIRNHKTQTSVAVCNIKSLNRWAITGTPIHNKEADFFTLLKFVRCKPFDDWAVWKRWVSNNDDAGKHRLSLLVKTLMLRRTKSELTQFTTFNLPKKEINTIEIELSKEERRAYEKLLQFSSNLFATYLYDRVAKEKVFDPNIEVQCKVQYFQEQNQDKDDVFKDHPELIKLFRQFKEINEIQTYHILVLLLRLRQICCHPILIKGPITEESIKKEDNIESIPEDDTDVFNNDSYNENTDIDSFPNNIDLSELMSCLTLEDEPVKKKPVIESNIFQKSWISTKIKTICDLVNQKVLIEGNKEKAIIVSQWPSFLYLIRKHLETTGNAKMEMFSGAIPIAKRNKIISEFNQPNSGPQILLLSLKAGGVGLNLMAANHMFLVDIHWNPQLEAQACDRVYRVGQTKPVYVYKFICSNTIETRIMNIQTHKLQMADNLFKGTSITSKITIDDLKQIFQFH